MAGENFLRAAYSYLYIRDFDGALDAFARAIACEPHNAAYYLSGSLTALRSQRYAFALSWARLAAHHAPMEKLYADHLCVVESSILTRYGRRFESVGKLQQAKSLFTAAAKLDPLNHDAARHLNLLDVEEATQGSVAATADEP